MAEKPDKVHPESYGRAVSAYEVTFANVSNISSHPYSASLTLFSSFPLNLARQGMGAEGAGKGPQASLTLVTISGQELLLTGKQ